MGELLVLSPFDFVLRSLIVVVVACCRPVLESLFVLLVDAMLELVCWGLSPPVVVLEELVIEIDALLHVNVFAREAFGNVTLLDDVFGPDLRNMEVGQERIVAIELKQLVFVAAVEIDWVLHAAVLVRKDYLGVAMLISWRIEVVDLQILGLLLLIKSEEEVFPGDNLFILARSKLFSR